VKNLKILVFGGLGFMGSSFVNWCLSNRPNFEMKIADAFTYAADPSRLSSEFQGEVRRANLNNPGDYVDQLEWCDLVVNFAAETHNDNSLESPWNFIETNVNGLFELLQACTNLDKPLVQISTDEVFGDFPLESNEVATEDYPFKPSSPYSATKAAGDLMVMAWVRSFGLKAIVTHCTNNYGPGQHREKFIPNVIAKINAGIPIEIYGAGENVRDWVHVDDHSSAVALLIEKGDWGEVYNISAYNYLSNNEVVRLIKSDLGRANHEVVYVKDRPGHDLRYGLDSSKIRALGWEPSATEGKGLTSLFSKCIDRSVGGV
jgi:dTDP-glucose 4,6-dehydratase